MQIDLLIIATLKQLNTQFLLIKKENGITKGKV